MQFRKYMHIERLGREEVEGILDGVVYVQPKIDGSNAVVYLNDKGELTAGSRNRELTLEADNAGFCEKIHDKLNIEVNGLKQYLDRHPHHYIYGEWLVKHQIKYYVPEAWKHFFVFDVFDAEQQRYLKPKEFADELVADKVRVIPTIRIIYHPTMEQLTELLESNYYLIPDDVDKIGEGIVLKNYDFVNKYGRTTFAKIVAAEFLKNKSQPKHKTVASKENGFEEACLEYLTEEMILKEYEKIKSDPNGNRNIQVRLLNTVWHTFLIEEITVIDKKFKSPTLDLRSLKALVFGKIKATLPMLF